MGVDVPSGDSENDHAPAIGSLVDTPQQPADLAVIRPLASFIAISFVGVVVLAGLFSRSSGSYGLLCVAIAGLTCSGLGLVSLILGLWSKGRSHAEQLMATLGGMAIRLLGGLAVCLAVFLTVPHFRESRERELKFWSAVLLCYLGTLVAEQLIMGRSK